MGCLTRIGCTTVLVAGGIVGYWLYGNRLPSVLSRVATDATDRITRTVTRASQRYDSADGPALARELDEARQAKLKEQDRKTGWVSIAGGNGAGNDKALAASRSGSQSGGRASALAPLASKTGPAYVSLTAADIAEVMEPLIKQLPPSATHVQLALKDDRLLLRAVISLADFAGNGGLLGLLGGALDGRDTLYMAGPLEPIKQGMVQFRVAELRLRGIDVPNRLIPPVVRSLRTFGEQLAASGNERIDRTAGTSKETVKETATRAKPTGTTELADDGLPVPLPASVSDARVVGGRLTLYRAVASQGVNSTSRKP